MKEPTATAKPLPAHLAGLGRATAASADTARRSSSAFVRKYSQSGGRTAPSTSLLVDQFGNDLLGADYAHTNIHGQPLQPETDEFANYTPKAPEFTYEQAQRKSEAAKLNAYRREPFKQEQVDEVRFRVCMVMARDCIRDRVLPAIIFYLWWEDATRPDVYELRQGNPPSNADRPRHLRKLDLEVDLTGGIPDDIQALVRPNGQLDDMVQECMDESNDPRISSAQVLMETIKRLAAVYAWRGGRVR